MIAIALDPGVTTGYAMGGIDDGLMTVVTGEQRWDHIGLWQFLTNGKPDFIICERFEFRQGKVTKENQYRKGLELFSRELIGVVHLYQQLEKARNDRDVNVYMQNPMKEPKPGKIPNTQFTNAVLQAHAIYKPGNGHANDAARHILHWWEVGPGYKYNTKGYKSGILS
jgi:hypothetical protein